MIYLSLNRNSLPKHYKYWQPSCHFIGMTCLEIAIIMVPTSLHCPSMTKSTCNMCTQKIPWCGHYIAFSTIYDTSQPVKEFEDRQISVNSLMYGPASVNTVWAINLESKRSMWCLPWGIEHASNSYQHVAITKNTLATMINDMCHSFIDY